VPPQGFAPVKKRRSKAPWLIGIGAFVLVLLGCGGFAVYTYYDNTIKPRNQKTEFVQLIIEYGAPPDFVDDKFNDLLYPAYATQSYLLQCRPQGCSTDAVAAIYGWAQKHGFNGVTLDSLKRCSPNACTHVVERDGITVVLSLTNYPAAAPPDGVMWHLLLDFRRHK
jgi:hypothetical protein